MPRSAKWWLTPEPSEPVQISEPPAVIVSELPEPATDTNVGYTQMEEEAAETILMEDERIEAALIEQGYYREDIPLPFLEQDFLHTAADEFGIDYYIMVALIDRETDFRNITGDNGRAYGYCQIWPKWWSGLMAEIGAEDLNEPYDNFRTAAAILARHMKNYGSIEDALTAYNTGGPGRSQYATDVMTTAEKWRNGTP